MQATETDSTETDLPSIHIQSSTDKPWDRTHVPA